MTQSPLQRRIHADRRAAGVRARMHARRLRWAEAARIRENFSPADLESEEARLALEIAAFPVTRCDPQIRLEGDK